MPSMQSVSYLLGTTLVSMRSTSGMNCANTLSAYAFEAVTEITVLAQDHPRLLSVIAGACAAAGGNIVDAQVFTTADGRALDTIEEVSELYSISGTYDLLVKCNLQTEADVGRFVTGRLQTLPNVKDTLTIITFNAFT